MMCRHHLGETASYFLVREILVPGEGFEPPTFGLQNRCTTTVLTRHRGIGSLFVGYRGLVKHFRIGKMVGQGLPSTQQSAFQSLPNGHLRVLYTVLLHCPATLSCIAAEHVHKKKDLPPCRVWTPPYNRHSCKRRRIGASHLRSRPLQGTTHLTCAAKRTPRPGDRSSPALYS